MMGGAAERHGRARSDRRVQIAAPGLEIIDLADQGVGAIAGPRRPAGAHLVPAPRRRALLDTTLMQIMPVGFARLLLDNRRPAPRRGRGRRRRRGRDRRRPPPAVRAGHDAAGGAAGHLPVAGRGLRSAGGTGDIGLLLDVPLQVTVELGRTQLRIRNVLELVPGSIVELDKLAGEPVDVLVNGKQIARGEVVVIDEEFGVRITDVASQAKRLRGLAADET